MVHSVKMNSIYYFLPHISSYHMEKCAKYLLHEKNKFLFLKPYLYKLITYAPKLSLITKPPLSTTHRGRIIETLECRLLLFHKCTKLNFHAPFS